MTRASDARPSVDRLRRVTRWRSERPAAVWVTLLVLGGIAVLAGCIYVLPRVLVPPRSAASLATVADAATRLELEDARLQQRNDVRTTLLQGLAGAVVAVGLSLTWRQIRVNQEGQITERFNKAIDHLGSDKLDLRLGGIYALERIARNSKDDRDTIAEILSAFVRQRSPWPPSQPGQYRDDFTIERQPELRRRAGDVQAVLTVLGRGGFTRQGTLRLDLAGVDLRRAVLHDAHLEGANLVRAHLEGAYLVNVHLDGAFLISAHLVVANLHDVHLKDADLTRADLKGANLRDAGLQGANFSHADLKSAMFVNADLEGANLRNADLKGAILRGAGLQGADLDSADLQRADLRGARLSRANLSGTALEGAKLSGARLSATNLGEALFEGAVADSSTEWPEDFDPMSNGIKVIALEAGETGAR
jgi:uncharacterized protein YjbI with pentapeptide repeats